MDLKYKVGDTVYVEGKIIVVPIDNDNPFYCVNFGNSGGMWFLDEYLLPKLPSPLSADHIDDLIVSLQRFKAAQEEPKQDTPDLLKACRRAFKYLNTMHAPWDRNEEPIIDQLREAITKAERS